MHKINGRICICHLHMKKEKKKINYLFIKKSWLQLEIKNNKIIKAIIINNGESETIKFFIYYIFYFYL